jgi:pimeloyl-ACP methyl ester carboxylesterase
MTEPTFEHLDVNGLRMKVAIQGNGPLVLLCHGLPELWISWRAQMQALADAGYRAVAPDMRGYCRDCAAAISCGAQVIGFSGSVHPL